jgi:1-acyl-sn-glycerol-3-phosphate acyltransferase
MNVSKIFIIWPLLIIVFLFLICYLIAIAFQISFLIGIGILLYFITPIMDDLIPLRDICEYGIRQTSEWIADKLRVDCPVEGLKESFEDQKTLNAIYVCHPHGFLALAPFIHFSLGKERVGVITTPIMFKVPIFGWFLRQLGLLPSDRESIEAVDGRIAVLLGGAREAEATKAGKMRLCVDRKGIFEIAVKQGRCLVPVLSYGENEIFSVPNMGLLGRFQEWLRKTFHFTFIFPKPADIWNWMTGQHKIHTYVGPAVEPEETWEKTREKYIEALVQLYKNTKPPEYEDDIEFIWKSDK